MPISGRSVIAASAEMSDQHSHMPRGSSPGYAVDEVVGDPERVCPDLLPELSHFTQITPARGAAVHLALRLRQDQPDLQRPAVRRIRVALPQTSLSLMWQGARCARCIIERKLKATVLSAGSQLRRIEPDRHRAVVDQLDLHLRTEAAGGHRETERA